VPTVVVTLELPSPPVGSGWVVGAVSVWLAPPVSLDAAAVVEELAASEELPAELSLSVVVH